MLVTLGVRCCGGRLHQRWRLIEWPSHVAFDSRSSPCWPPFWISLAIAFPTHAAIVQTELTVNFPGLGQVDVYVRVEDGVPGGYGTAVDGHFSQADSTMFSLHPDTYDVLLIKGAKSLVV